MLELDCGQAFDPLDATCEGDFFAKVPARAGVLLVAMREAGAEPYLLKTADLRRAAERLLRAPEEASKRLNLRAVAAGIRYRATGSKFEQTLAFYQHAKRNFPGRYRALLRLRGPAVLKVNLRNQYPRCYATRRIRADEGFYFGPFVSRRAADAFAEGFLDLFKIRRCQIKIRRDPSFPGCIYSEMKMCLAPCFAGSTKEEYDAEVGRVLEALASTGETLRTTLEREREAASEALDFERAAALHKRLEKVSTALRGLPELARSVRDLDAVILERAAEEKTVALFPLFAGMLDEPIFLRFGEISSQPRSVEAMIREKLEAPASGPSEKPAEAAPKTNWHERYCLHEAPAELGEHLSLVARWFYSKPREGEILFRDGEWPYRRILRACARLLAPPGQAPTETVRPNW
jgi:excinuclease ABC subunit C